MSNYILYIIIILVVVLAGIKITFFNKVPLKLFFSPSRIRVYIIYLLKSLLKRLDGSSIYLERWELIQYASRVAKCQPCVKAELCVNCSCDAVGLINIRDSKCEHAGGFGYFKTKEEFELFEERFDWELTYTVKPKS